MKLLVVSAVAGLFFSLAGSTPANTLKTDPDPGEKTERAMPVGPQITVTLCVASGTLTVNGSDKNELRVTTSAKVLDLRRLDKPRDPSAPAARVDVMIFESAAKATQKFDCSAVADVDMQVPAGAAVLVQTRDGDVRITGVAAAYAGSQNGDITIVGATKLVDAGSIGGSITLRDSGGRVNLNSAGGIIEVSNVKAATGDDTFEVGTISGDIQLERVSNPKVSIRTTNGNVTMLGPLTKSGHYVFNNMTGDVILGLPHDASFKLSAKVSERRDIVSDFALKYLPDTPPAGTPVPEPPSPPASASPTPKPGPPGAVGPVSPVGPITRQPSAIAKGHPPQKTGPVISVQIEKPIVVPPYVLRRVNAICGSGDATILVASFGGTVRLKKL
ncbi:MAG TPA: DUF4097 family beta strand repeat-containing protein [Pyrinomonadaceae bacterium]|nr:DUF4097 family beta strand repeat-containing protein [Pyrinomonadaceae bacterium]